MNESPVSELPPPKFKIGDRVWYGTYRESREEQECPDCRGSGEWSVTTPAGLDFKVPCVRCGGRRVLTTPGYATSVRQLTIGSVRMDTASREGLYSFMCTETGVGSGAVYYERDLHVSERLAEQHAQSAAACAKFDREERNPQLAEQRRLNEYQVHEALSGKEKALRQKAESRLNRLLERICELSTSPVAGNRYEEKNKVRFVSLTKDQVAVVQESLVWLNEEDSDFLDAWRAEDEKCECD